jgi:uncharacterized protein YcaQ
VFFGGPVDEPLLAELTATLPLLGATFAAEHAALLAEVRAEIRARGPLGNRDFAGTAHVQSYRGRKDTALALYHLWLTGELLTHSRLGFERLYDLRERVSPAALDTEATEADAAHYFAAKSLRQVGLGTQRGWASAVAYQLHRRLTRAEARDWLAELVASGAARTIEIEGVKERYYLPAADTPLLLAIQAGEIPDEWRASGSTTTQEINLLSPLDNLLDRQRTQALFDFAYLWEVYKPAERRRWGSYTMPIMYADRLVGRLDPKLNRQTETLQINGLWLEDTATADDPAFVTALAHGLAHFARFHAARTIVLAAGYPAGLREQLDTASLG